ncbi:MAG: hypothetical protein ACI8YQ_002685 [Polaribacter sp.]
MQSIIISNNTQMQEQEQQYQQLKQELQPFMTMMGNASETIVLEEVSSYPIFVLHKEEVALGIPLKEYEGVVMDWGINASTLEEFVAKQIIQNDKVEEFKKIYKPADSQLCLFLITKDGATFVFLPRS